MARTREQVLERMAATGLVPVLRAGSPDEARALAEAVLAGGVDVLELTLTVPGALPVLAELRARYPELVLGAGTVLDPETARLAILHGAEFIVSPALDLRTVELCRRYAVAVLPGALTPTEIVAAWQAGADVVKIFPANAMGGASYLNSLRGPLPQVRVVPTGGVSLETAPEFLAAGAFALGVGSDLMDAQAVRAGRAAEVTAKAAEYLRVVRAARGLSTLPRASVAERP